MKLVWISHSDSMMGGAELALLEAIEGLLAKGQEIYVVFPSWGELTRKAQEMGASVFVIPHYESWVYSSFTPNWHYRIRRIISNLRRAQQLVRLFRELQPDVVISNTIGSPAGALASKWAKVPHVWYIHEMFGADCQQGVYFDLGASFTLFVMNKFSHYLIVNSLAVLERYKTGVPIRKLKLVFSSVKMPQLHAVSTTTDELFRLIVVGRVTPGKRQEDAIRAVALLVKRGLKIQLTIVGSQDLEYSIFLRGLTTDLGVDNEVEFVDFIPNPHILVSQSDIALMCSKGEAFGRVTVEAMKLGKPVIGAKSAGTCELIRDGENGFLYRLGDVGDLSQHIEVVYNDRTLLRQMGEAASQWSNAQFTTEKYTSELFEVFEAARMKIPAHELRVVNQES